MRDYLAFYQGKQISVKADSSFAAQEAAAKLFKARKSYQVTVFLADVPVHPASL